jgi:D-alanine-D-alanine ligase
MTGRICVLHNAIGDGASLDARDVLVQVEEVCAALNALGYEALPLAVGLDLEHTQSALLDLHPVGAFNLVEEVGGHAELITAVPMLLDGISVPYTGASATGMFLTSNKVLAKYWLERHALPTPAWFEVDPPRAAPAGRWIVKPVWEDASVGLIDASVVSTAEKARERLSHVRTDGGTWFAESFVDGREINVSLLANGSGVEVLPIAEIRFIDYPPDKPRIVGYKAKWNEDSFEYRHTLRDFALASAEPALHARLAALARMCWQLFDMRGYARVDLRIDAQGEPWVLEINANPCLSSDAGFAAALVEAGIPFERAVARILAATPGFAR